MHIELVRPEIADDRLRAQLGTAEDLTRRAVEQLRSAIYALGAGDGCAAEDLPSMLRRLSGVHMPDELRVEVRIGGEPVALPGDCEQSLFRIAGEALFNTAVHADASRAVVRLAYRPGQVRLTVSDDGGGSPEGMRRSLRAAGAAPSGEHRGLVNMQARARELGGVACRWTCRYPAPGRVPHDDADRRTPGARAPGTGADRAGGRSVDHAAGPAGRAGAGGRPARRRRGRHAGRGRGRGGRVAPARRAARPQAHRRSADRRPRRLPAAVRRPPRARGARADHVRRGPARRGVGAGGARGYVVEDVDTTELVRAIRAVSRGESAFDARSASAMVRSLSGGVPARERLTERELDVLRLLARGLSNRAIGAELFISETTVKFHVGNLMRKLVVGRRAEAVYAATKLGLL